MATLASAKTKYRAKLSTMPENYYEGVASFLGTSASSVRSSGPGMAYGAKMVAGIEDKWERELRAAFGG